MNKSDSTAAWRSRHRWSNLLKVSLVLAVVLLGLAFIILYNNQQGIINELAEGGQAKEEAVTELCEELPKDPACKKAEEIPSTAKILDGAEVQDPEVQEEEIQDPEIQDPENQNAEFQDAERQDRERQDREEQDGELQDIEEQEAEEQEDEIQEEETQDSEVQEAEEQEPEVQDEEVQNPEQDDPEPNDPQDPAQSLTFNNMPGPGQTTTCTRDAGSPPRNPTYTCTTEGGTP